jgi:hypothetical protein
MTDNLLIDTSVVLYALRGAPHKSKLPENQIINISFITEIELLSWANLSAQGGDLIKKFMESCRVIEYSSQLKHEVIEVRKKINLKMKDAFIAATALQHDIPLVLSIWPLAKSKKLIF